MKKDSFNVLRCSGSGSVLDFCDSRVPVSVPVIVCGFGFRGTGTRFWFGFTALIITKLLFHLPSFNVLVVASLLCILLLLLLFHFDMAHALIQHTIANST